MEQVAVGVVKFIAIALVYVGFQISGFVQVDRIKLEIVVVREVVEIFFGFPIRWYGGVICCRDWVFGSALCVHWENGGVLEGGDLIVVSREVGFVVTSESVQCVRNLMLRCGSMNDRKVECRQPKASTHEAAGWAIHAREKSIRAPSRLRFDGCEKFR